MEALARFVIRPADSENRGDLVLGAMLQTQNADLLAPGTVYEIREVAGYLMIVPVGDAHIGMSRRPGEDDVCWGNDVNHIITAGRGRYLLTTEEHARIQEENEKRYPSED